MKFSVKSIAIVAFATLATVFSANAQRRSRLDPTTPKPSTQVKTATSSADSSKPVAQVRKAVNAPVFRTIDTTKAAPMKMRMRKDEKGVEHKQEFRRRPRGGYGGGYGGNRPPVFNGNWNQQYNYFGSMGAGMLDAMTQFANTTMLSASQIFEMATLIPDEPNRLLFVQNSFHNCYDTYQYEAMMPLFSNPVYIRQFDDFLYDNLYEPYGNTNGYNWNTTSGGYNNGYGNGANNGYGNGYNNGYNDGYGNGANNGYGNGYNNGGYGNGGNNGYGNGYGNNGAPYYMSERDFADAYRSLQSITFEGTRLQTAKQITAANQMSVEQIKQICQLFTFETNRLDYAKYAYAFCVEPQSYFKVGDVFSFDSNRYELSQFLAANPRQPVTYQNNQGSYGGGNGGGTYNGGNGGGTYNGGNGGGGNGGNHGGNHGGHGGGGTDGRGNPYNSGGNFGNGQNPPPAPAGPVAISDSELQQIEQSLKAVRVESYRLDQAKNIVNSRYFTASQIRSLCRLPQTESYKLDLAKHCFSRCLDKQNYYLVNDVFGVESYKQQLAQFAANGGR